MGTGPVVGRRRALGWAGAAALGAFGPAACDRYPDRPGGHTSEAPGGGAGDLPRVHAPRAEGMLGANFNGEPKEVTGPELGELSATWLRGFVPTPALAEGAPARQPAVTKLLRAAARGYGTVLSLKFPYQHRALPSPGDPAMAAELRRLDALLPAVMNEVDILVIGNEPFIDTRPKDRRGRVNAFYEAVARHVIRHRAAHGGKAELYMGALNHLERPAWRTAATERWMRFVHDTPEIRGVDIHPHVPEPGADRAYLDYVLPRLRAEQRFLATEFSLVSFWRKHLHDRIPAGFAKRYGLPQDLRVWQLLKRAVAHPFPQEQWQDFLDSSPWFAENRGYLREQVTRFRGTGRLAVATYGISQGPSMAEHVGPHAQPWLLNSLFCPHTVRTGANGLPGGNEAWMHQFRALQRS